MKAMVLAAGLGTRLRPLTADRPKALVEVAGRTLLEIVLTRLREFGVTDVIVNVHHFADMVVDYLAARDSFGMRVEISRETTLLDTGGGLKQAAWFLRDGPFILHNVDILSSIDLGRMVQHHDGHAALVTLAVKQRPTSRPLLFDERMELCGRELAGGHVLEMVRPSPATRRLAFSGVHVVSPRIFSCMTEDGAFPIIPAYLRLAGEGEKILGFSADEYYWRDLGTPEGIEQAGRENWR